MTPLGREDDARNLRQIMRALPASPFYKVECDDQPVIVRVAHRQKKTYIYAANPFAEPVQLRIPAHLPGGNGLPGAWPLACRDHRSGGGEYPSRIDVPLDGYGLAAWEIDCEQCGHAGIPRGAVRAGDRIPQSQNPEVWKAGRRAAGEPAAKGLAPAFRSLL